IAMDSRVEVVADFERDPGGPFGDLMALIDHLIVSRRFARELTGEDDPAHAAEKLWTERRKAVVITCGEQGCWYLGKETDGRTRHCPAFPVEVVDTTGCGDVFHGTYAARLVEQSPLADRITFASATAALAARQPGGQAGCPTLATVEAFLEERGRGT
ncbi:MAG TPA: PfkB family carbohydrate kinase, partial [Thermoguttaceae bacterium]|nr:PfkB family carbohydrate kinase [Thermoguttaceae bacterium]